MLANLTIPLLGAVDAAVIGHLGAAEIGAVTVGATVFSFVYWAFSFLRMGTTGFAAQAHGAGDHAELLAVFGRGALLGLGFGVMIVALQWPLIEATLRLIAPSDAVTSLTRDYIVLRVWAAPAALVNLVVLGWLMGRQRMVAALMLQLLINGANIGLDVVLAVWLGMGVAGVGLATGIAQVIGLGAGLWLVAREARAIHATWPWPAIMDWTRLVAMMRINRDIFIRTLCITGSFALFTAIGARFGDVILAANGVLMLLQAFLAYGLDGFAHAAEALVGQAVGARDRPGFAAAVRISTLWAAVVSLGYGVVYWLFGPLFVDLITSVPEVRLTARDYLIWAVISPLVSIWSYQLDGIFIGATRGPAMRNAALLALATYGAALLILVPEWHNHGLWLAMMVLMVARAVTLGAYYPRLARDMAVHAA
jgi:MATE family multidrug resistance protein